ncbi:hypothetical protein Aasi_0901 [Candidatus Amoebophilus asiaticus 5a2]|uniref:asparagine synthase (glutamine-hydrolyzing) n=1 Tax=Amoebophilus asiaticus (strain 5a2) TaxID=452471 RepID=B3ESR6_AMOA5|nr:asparagine synthase-related protein [Candidatus Amoebophilus asiaticus]ACE06268.1 hypothetical protein Aasi_0901 [Candidatus Amoebophilus asiaticus 5a2]
MIYAGIIHFNNVPDKGHELSTSLESYTHKTPSIIRKKSLTLCYGKLSYLNDMDDVWESSTSVLMGRIFDKTHYCSFKKEDFKNLSLINKERILERLWGKYVYIYIDEQASQFKICIDPTGQLPLFYYFFPDGNILFSSDIELIFKILSRKTEYNWTYLNSYLLYGNSSAIQTPFQDIYEIPPGCCLKANQKEHKTEPYWDPLYSYKKSAPQDKDAVNILKTTLRPWVEPYKHICVSLSGGLDSSSLAYCLKEVKKEDQVLSAVNVFHASIKSSNELPYARKVCQETGINLTEVDMSDSLPFDPPHKKQLINLNKPFHGLLCLRELEVMFDQIPTNNSSIILSGHGSDHIFMRSFPAKALSDYILEKGLKGSRKPLKNITHFYRETLFSILKENAKSLSSYYFSGRLPKRHPKNSRELPPAWVKQESRQQSYPVFMHPIYEELPSKILPGKYKQLDAVYEGIASIHIEMNPINPLFYPFLYEPVVEFALSLPTYTLFDNGYDRYPLRKAVSDHFQTETVWRRDKGQTTGLFQKGIKKNLESILDICLDGKFAKQGLINKDELYKTIVLISNGDTKHMWYFMNIFSIEMFLRHWEEINFEQNRKL